MYLSSPQISLGISKSEQPLIHVFKKSDFEFILNEKSFIIGLMQSAECTERL